MFSDQIVVLCPREQVSLDLRAAQEAREPEVLSTLFAEDSVEEMVVCLATIEAAWAAGEFGRLPGTLRTLVQLAERTGLPSVAAVAQMACGLVGGRDDVALAAVVSRLVRVGETSLATLLEISYRQI